MNDAEAGERDALLRDWRLELPSYDESIRYVRGSGKPSTHELYVQAQSQGRLTIQPRLGVGGFEEMKRLLQALDEGARPDILTLTIDSYTRLGKFDAASALLAKDPSGLNGYPLVSHGWRKTRILNESVRVPLQVRHGSPDARLLFEVAVASGITSFEGGGIGYNLPYCKTVPLEVSLAAWCYVDRACGELARRGAIVERELFGTLSAVLMPPSISLAVTLIEARLAAAEGVRCVSIAYPQGGNAVQDIAALRAIRALAKLYLPPDVDVFPVLHEYMGPFPRQRAKADALIIFGALIAKLGGATKVVTKTYDEAFGVPTLAANAQGVELARLADDDKLAFIRVDEAAVEEELELILSEVRQLVQPLLDESDLVQGVLDSFESGRMDIPFSTSRSAHSKVVPMRDRSGAIRILDPGNLSLDGESLRKNRRLLGGRAHADDVMAEVLTDIHYFV